METYATGELIDIKFDTSQKDNIERLFREKILRLAEGDSDKELLVVPVSVGDGVIVCRVLKYFQFNQNPSDS